MRDPGSRKPDSLKEGHDPGLDGLELKKVEQAEPLSAAVVHEVIRRQGMTELERRPLALGLSALAGGLAMGLAVLARAALHHGLPETTWRPMVASLGYAIGFLAIVLGHQHLYTENTLTPVVSYLAKRTAGLLRRVLSLGGVVLLGNLIGTLLFAWAMGRTAMAPDGIRESMRTLALEAMAPGPLAIFARAIVAGWIVALMVWMLPSAGSAKFLVITIMAWLIGAAHLSHVIVGAVEALYLVVLRDISIASAFGGYIVPALLGNTVGGLLIVAVLNHAQVHHE